MNISENVSSSVIEQDPNGKLAMLQKLEQLGETLGEYKGYDNQLEIAEVVGTRIVKCLYQKNKATGKTAGANSYVRIPVHHLTEEDIVERISELSPYVLAYLQEVESGMIKSDHRNGLLSVYCEALSLDKIIDKLESDEAGARLNKDKIAVWFVAELQDSLAVRFADKLGITDDSSEADLAKLEMILTAYRMKFESLAGGKTFIKEADCMSMVAVIKECSAEDSLLGSRFISRLEKMGDKQEDILMAL